LYQITLTCTLDDESVSETLEIEVVLPPADLSLDAQVISTGFAGARFVKLQVSNISQQDALGLRLNATAPAGYDVVAGYRLAPSCNVEPSGSGTVRCDVDLIPDWQCTVDSDLACTLEQLPAGASASVVVELQGSGTSTLSGSVSAENAAEVSTQLQINN